MSNLLAAVNNVFAPQLNANFDHYEKLLNEKDPGENDFGILPTGTQVFVSTHQMHRRAWYTLFSLAITTPSLLFGALFSDAFFTWVTISISFHLLCFGIFFELSRFEYQNQVKEGLWMQGIFFFGATGDTVVRLHKINQHHEYTFSKDSIERIMVEPRRVRAWAGCFALPRLEPCLVIRGTPQGWNAVTDCLYPASALVAPAHKVAAALRGRVNPLSEEGGLSRGRDRDAAAARRRSQGLEQALRSGSQDSRRSARSGASDSARGSSRGPRRTPGPVAAPAAAPRPRQDTGDSTSEGGGGRDRRGGRPVLLAGMGGAAEDRGAGVDGV